MTDFKDFYQQPKPPSQQSGELEKTNRKLKEQNFILKYKTEICRNWEQGYCEFGDLCAFSHGYQELRGKAYQDEATLKVPSNINISTAAQINSQNKPRSISEDFIVKFKTELCRNWENNRICDFGQHCAFAHGIEELRRKHPNSNQMSPYILHPYQYQPPIYQVHSFHYINQMPIPKNVQKPININYPVQPLIEVPEKELEDLKDLELPQDYQIVEQEQSPKKYECEDSYLAYQKYWKQEKQQKSESNLNIPILMEVGCEEFFNNKGSPTVSTTVSTPSLISKLNTEEMSEVSYKQTKIKRIRANSEASFFTYLSEGIFKNPATNINNLHQQIPEYKARRYLFIQIPPSNV